MKTRHGYVSNSSSTSFVMVPEKAVKAMHERTDPLDESPLKEMFLKALERDDAMYDGKWTGLIDGGVREFGWDVESYHDEETKWNWLVLQAYYGGDEWHEHRTSEYRERLESYLHDIGFDVSIDWDGISRLESDCDAYIDHQSIDSDGTFDMVDRVGISEFLLSPDCFVHTDNDNHY